MKNCITPTINHPNLRSIKTSTIKEKLSENGYLLLKNFNPKLEDFSEFVKNNSSKITLDPAREFHSDTAQKVDAGTQKVGLHIENGNGPLISDYCWFYCRTSPKVSSPTTICDGKIIYNNLPQHLRSLFEENQSIIFSRNVEEKLWRKYVAHQLNGTVDPKVVNEHHLSLIQQQLPKVNFTINNDNSLFYQFETPPIFTKDKEKYFANSILGPSFNYEKPRITFKNGIEVSEQIKKELALLTEKHTVEIEWEDGDILLIDNKRVMHGRREIRCSQREIFNALSFKK